MKKKQVSENIPDSLFGLPLFPEPPVLGEGRSKTEQQLTATVQERLANFSVAEATEKLQEEMEEVWVERGQKRAIALFHAAAEYVPAYKKLLLEHGINPASVKTFDDFVSIVPIIDKESYIQKYPLRERYWHGQLSNADMIVASSGTYGKKPTMWPRSQILEAQAYLDHELAMAEMFELEKKSTLVVICFAMGMHIAGTITMQSMIHLSKRGYPLSVMTPGYTTDDILSIVKELSGSYDQTVLAGYPPYMKEVVDQGYMKGIDWKKINTRFVFAAEGFNESWRTYMGELTNSDPLTDFLSIYGSADAAAMAQETFTSIAIRRKILANKDMRTGLFNSQRLPALFQYYPEHKYIEAVDGEIVITATAGIPLVRYNIHDQGGIVSAVDVRKQRELSAELERLESQNQATKLPFVYVFGRKNQMAVLYGANIYLEHVRHAAESRSIREYLSGKIILVTKEDDRNDQRLYIEMECSQDISPSEDMEKEIQKKIEEVLLDMNSEYRVVRQSIGEKAMPIIKLHVHGSEQFHQKGMKHKWTNKKQGK